MESFFRYISYVDYYKKQERIRNVGFFRWKLYQGTHKMELQIKDLNWPQGYYKIQEINTGKVLGEVFLDQGIGTFMKEFDSMSASGEKYINILGERLYLCDVKGFRINLNYEESLSVIICVEEEKTKEETLRDVKEKEEDYIEIVNIKNDKELGTEEIKISLESKNQLITDKKIKIMEPVHEDKWEELCKQYPGVHPFPDKKTFLSVKPEDFIILQQEYQKLVKNSFLLHGFYNYGHMILGKLTEEEEAPLYIGVPGVYYEREKQAAQMFGFVGFESTEHPVQAGSYGYYMIEVKI